jgi:hypothetical protein
MEGLAACDSLEHPPVALVVLATEFLWELLVARFRLIGEHFQLPMDWPL